MSRYTFLYKEKEYSCCCNFSIDSFSQFLISNALSHSQNNIFMKGIVNPGVSTDHVFVLVFTPMVIATMGFYRIGHMIDSNASGSKFFNALFCAVATFTTYIRI
jgi:hypothetical protein